MRWGFLALMLAAVAAQGATIKFQNRLVTEVLADYERAGFEILRTTGLVDAEQKFSSEPTAGSPEARLASALNEIGLRLRREQDVWLVVRDRQRPAVSLNYSGRVVNELTGKPISGARIEIGQFKTTTDSQGRFSLDAGAASPSSIRRQDSNTASAMRVRASMDGFTTTQVQADEALDALLEISLAPTPRIEQIVVVSSRHAIQTGAASTLHIQDMQLLDSMPSLGEDPLRISHHLPGMATNGVSAKPHIRGGSQDELLVLFNNIELLEPFHLRDFQSVFAAFNPSVIQSIDVYTGGYPAKYGDRMSGVMAIEPADQYQSDLGELSVSLLNTSGLLHNTFAEGRGEWVVSARRGNLDLVTKQVNSSLGEPSYADWYGQLKYELSATTEIDVGFVGYQDDVSLQDFETDGEIAKSSYDNLYTWLQLHRAWTPTVDGTSYFYYGSVEHDRTGQLVDEDPDNGTAFVDDNRRFKLWSLGQLLNFTLSDQLLAEIGGRVTHQSGAYDYRAVIQRGEFAELLGIEPDDDRDFRLRPKGFSGGLFGSLRYQPRRWLTVEGGLRWDFQDYGDAGMRNQVSPRLGIKFDPNEHNQIRLSAGRFYQPEGIHELQIGDGVDTYQIEQYADHYILGWHRQFGDSDWSLRTELFHKDIRDPKLRFENLFNPMVLLPELAADRVLIRPERARASGVEATLKYQNAQSNLFWVTFTQSNIDDRIGGRWRPRIWDQGQSVSAGVSWQFNRWDVGMSALWHAGWRTTALPLEASEGEVISFERNASRLRDYFSLDLQVSRTWTWRNQSLMAFLELTNVANRRNVGGIEHDVEFEDGEVSIDPSEETLLPLVPSIGIRWMF